MTTDRNMLLDVDDLAQFIRSIDGNNSMGADALAEKICERFAALLQAQDTLASLQAQKAAHIIEALSYHARERDDLTLDEALDYLRQGWKKVCGRSERELILQITALLAGSPPSSDSATHDGELVRAQVWNEAIEAAANKAYEHGLIALAELILSLKRPSQAQEPIPVSFGGIDFVLTPSAPEQSVSGAVDELPSLPMPYAHSGLGLPLFCERDMREYALLALSRAQATQQSSDDPADCELGGGNACFCRSESGCASESCKHYIEQKIPAQPEATQPAQIAPVVSEQAEALRIVHEEAGRTLSRADFNLCMRIAKRALLSQPAATTLAEAVERANAKIIACSQPAAAAALALPKAVGVSRDAESPGQKSVLVAFKERLTDDQLRALHELLAGRTAAAPVSEQTVPEGWRKALHAAVSALYFDDSSDFKSALGSVVRHLDPVLASELLGTPGTAYKKACDLVAALSNQSQGGNKS
jgi:hypothetical protein